MKKEIIIAAIPYLILALLVIYLINRAGKKVAEVTESLKSGDILKSKEEIKTDKAVLEKTTKQASNWFEKELALPAREKTQIKRSTALNIANMLHSELRNTIQTMTGANQIYALFQKIGTTGSLYYVLGEFGIRDGKDLPQYLYEKVGFNNVFSKDLDEINALFASRKINFKF